MKWGITMSKCKKTDDTTIEVSTVRSGKEVVDETVVSNTVEPTIINLEDLDEFDPAATHEDFSEDDDFDDDDEPF